MRAAARNALALLAGLFMTLAAVDRTAAAPPAHGGALAAARFELTLDGHSLAVFSELVILGDVAAARKSVSLTAYDAGGRPVARYHLTDAYPMKVEVTTLRAGASEVLMETVTMACEFIQRVSV